MSTINYLSMDLGKENLGFAIITIETMPEDTHTDDPRDTMKFGAKRLFYDLFSIDSTMKTKEFKAKYKNYPMSLSRPRVLCDFLTNLNEIYKFNKIIVEKQVVNNVVAMMLESMIVMFAMDHQIEIEVFDPKRKFENVTYNSKAKEHKKIVVTMARNIMNEYTCDSDKFETFPKKDDISDAIVMCHMVAKNDISKAYV